MRKKVGMGVVGLIRVDVIVSYIVVLGVLVGGVIVVCVGTYPERFRSIYLFTFEL